ncbi:MAG: hypothetical protein ACOYL5_13880 [Phototrophicaceae bacterium]
MPTPSTISINQLTPFIGRAREIHELSARISEPHCRLLTIVGVGGVFPPL